MRCFPNAAAITVATMASLVLAQESDQGKEDVARMQGEWSMVSGSVDGQAMPNEMLPSAKRVCKGNETTVTIGPQLIMQATFTVDPTKNPKAIDYQVTDGPTKGKKHLGIYAFDGDTVRYCFAAPDDERPPDFNSKPGERRTLSVWKRAKP